MDSAPELPTQISGDGKELWDWAGKLSAHTQKLDRIRKLEVRISELGVFCGGCDKWMKSRDCPHERNLNGRNVGPSSKTVKCASFVESRAETKLREKLKQELALETNGAADNSNGSMTTAGGQEK